MAVSRAGARLLALTLLGLLAGPTAGEAETGLGVADGAAGGHTLSAVRDRGVLQCGITSTGIGLSEIDADGNWRGFFPDLCRALAAAIFGDSEAVEFVEIDFVIRFDALRDGAFDVLMSMTTWTSGRDSRLALAFTQTLLYDGQGFLAHRSLGATRLADLTEATVCVHDNTTTIANLRDLVAARFPGFQVLAFHSLEGGYAAFFSRQCDLLTLDRVGLLAQRLSWASEPEDYVLFPDIISREPLSPAVRQDDPLWFDIVQWTMFALIVAEEHGVDSTNVAEAREWDQPEVARLLGVEGTVGADLGLDADWAYQVIRQVGNYGEVFERTLGSAIGMERGLNDLWTRGGLIYAPPFR